MQLSRLFFRTGRHLFVGPGSMCNSALQQGTVAKLVRENRLQQVQVRKYDPLCLQDSLVVIKPEASSNLATKLPAIE